MKRMILLAFIVHCMVNAEAQKWSVGFKATSGLGWINSENLGKSLDARKAANHSIERFDKTWTPGFTYGFGAAVVYSFNGHFGLLGEVTLNSMQSKLSMDYTQNTVQDGNGDLTNVQSEAKITNWFISLPVMLKYSVLDGHGLYALAGIKTDFLREPRLESSETMTSVHYKGGAPSATLAEQRSSSATINVFNTTRFSVALGLGYAFNIKGRVLMLDVRYHLPITSSAMYTLNDNFAQSTFNNNKVFSLPGKTLNESYVGTQIDDYKITTVEVTVALLLYHRSAVSCFQAAKRCW